MAWAPGLVVMVDWSASSGRGPVRPTPDRCWLAWGRGRERPAPEYFRTRDACVTRLSALPDFYAANVANMRRGIATGFTGQRNV